MSEIGLNLNIEKLLQIYSEQTTPQKSLGLFLNEKYLDGLMFLKKWIEYIQSFWRTEWEMAKKRPK